MAALDVATGAKSPRSILVLSARLKPWPSTVAAPLKPCPSTAAARLKPCPSITEISNSTHYRERLPLDWSGGIGQTEPNLPAYREYRRRQSNEGRRRRAVAGTGDWTVAPPCLGWRSL